MQFIRVHAHIKFSSLSMSTTPQYGQPLHLSFSIISPLYLPNTAILPQKIPLCMDISCSCRKNDQPCIFCIKCMAGQRPTCQKAESGTQPRFHHFHLFLSILSKPHIYLAITNSTSYIALRGMYTHTSMPLKLQESAIA